jgi:exosortase/archaeosortase family protein
MKPASGRRVGVVVAAGAAALMLLTPFVATMDDLLAALAQRFGLDAAVAFIAVPEARLVTALLDLLGVAASSSGATITVDGATPVAMVVGWNCVGWQGLVLLGLTFLVGLRRQDGLEARVHIVLIGVLGTVLINLGRIALVAWLAASAGYYAAIFVHDWAATIATLAWLATFWMFAQRYVVNVAEETAPAY